MAPSLAAFLDGRSYKSSEVGEAPLAFLAYCFYLTALDLGPASSLRMSQPAGERESAAVNGHDELPTVSESVDTKDADASVDDKDAMSERIGSLTARDSPQPTQFRIYKKRWIGLVGLVRFSPLPSLRFIFLGSHR